LSIGVGFSPSLSRAASASPKFMRR